MSNSKKLQVRIDEYAYGVWFDTVELDPYNQTVTIVDGFGKETEMKDDGSFKYREVAVKE